MKVLREGHLYELDMFEDTEKGLGNQKIQFIEKCTMENCPEELRGNSIFDGKTNTDLVTINNGTTNEEVLSVLINRMNYLQSKFPCRENAIVITKLEESLMWLNKRTSDRMKRNVEGKHIV